MQRLNVGLTQLGKCIRNSMFAIDNEPVTHKLVPGELLLLQLNVVDARPLRKEHSRIEYALVFDHLEKDPERLLPWLN